jgi:large subunit ribosomal protein L23
MRSDILLEPVVTEKSNLQRTARKYTFKVDARANKHQILTAVREVFGVTPVKCNIVNVARKPKRVRHRPGHRASWKKAIVTLSVGDTIQVFEGA